MITKKLLKQGLQSKRLKETFPIIWIRLEKLLFFFWWSHLSHGHARPFKSVHFGQIFYRTSKVLGNWEKVTGWVNLKKNYFHFFIFIPGFFKKIKNIFKMSKMVEVTFFLSALPSSGFFLILFLGFIFLGFNLCFLFVFIKK